MKEKSVFVSVCVTFLILTSSVLAEQRHVPGVRLSTAVALGKPKNKTVGWIFSLERDILVTHLGVYNFNTSGPALNFPHEVGIWSEYSSTPIATAIVPAGVVTKYFSYVALEDSVVLAGGETYIIGCFYPANNTDSAVYDPISVTAGPYVNYMGHIEASGSFCKPDTPKPLYKGFGPNFLMIPPDPRLVELHITGPLEIYENSEIQYNAIAHYENGSQKNVASSAIWSVDPETIAAIDANGVLYTAAINEPQDIMLYVEYSEGGISRQVEIILHIDFDVVSERHVPAEYSTIQAAIDDANEGDTVIIDPGIYTGFGNRDISFRGKAITVRSIDPFDPNVVEQTVVSCQGSQTDRHRGFYFNSGEDSDSVLAGLTITNGYHPIGGGIYCESSPMIHHCVITNNTVRLYGGGISVGGGSPIISYCTIKNNRIFPRRYRKGGGIHCSGTPFIYNCVIKNNSAHYGSGVYCNGGNPTLFSCIITGNWVAYDGGGVYCNTSTNIINCTIVGNTSHANGDGVFCNRGASTIWNCIIWDNDGPEVTGSGFDLVYSDIQGGWPGEGNIDADPCFVDAAKGDYHLLEASPCIDASDPSYMGGANETDLDGEARLMGCRVDMGADEFTVVNRAPIGCIVGGDGVVESGEDCEGRVVLDGSCSSDADSTAGTNDDINDFDWYEVIDACEPNSDIYLGSGEVIECNLGLGEHLILLEVTDRACAFDTNEVVITVEDVTPPEFSLSVEPNVLWPPNHRMVRIEVSWEVSDDCDDEVEVSLVGVTSSEEDDGRGDGRTKNDIMIGDDGSIYLRAERTGSGAGRVYTITYEAVDDSGNATEASAEVLVPDGYRWRHRERIRLKTIETRRKKGV